MKLGDVCTIKYGKDHKKLSDGDIPVFGSGGVMRYADKALWKKPSVLIPRKGTLGNLFFVDRPFWTVDTLFWTDIDESLVLPHYLYYALKTKNLAELNVGTAVPSLTTDVLNEIEIDIPNLSKQTSVVAILKSFDDAIALIQQTNDYLLDLATAQFELALQNERRLVKFGDIVELEDSKRIPLNSRDREQRKGPYPYYGATSIMDYVDDYLFDGVRILLGEDGSVITDDGYPVLQYVWGKYWVNNHAHILKPCAEYPMEMLYVALSRTAIPHIVTGAVQKKISQKNLNTLILEMPNPRDVKGLEDLFSLYRNNVGENRKLESLRDTLLPKLMSGEMDVSAIVESTHE